MSGRIVFPLEAVYDANGDPLSGAKAYFYEVGTSTPKNTYSDSALSVPNTNPVIADANGRFSDIYGLGQYDLTVKDSSDVTIYGPKTIQILPDQDVQYTVSSVSSLKGLASSRLQDNDSAATLGYYAEGDGGHGRYFYDSSSSATDNGGSILQPTDAPATGRWILVDTVYNALQFGAKADGATDNVAFFNAWETACKADGKAMYLPSGTNFYAVDSTWSIESYDGFKLYGDGPYSMVAGTGAFSAIKLDNSDLFTIRDISLGSTSNSTSAHGIEIAFTTGSSRDGTIENVFAKNLGGSCVELTTGGLGLTLITPSFTTNSVSPFAAGLTTATAQRGVRIQGSSSNNAVTIIGPVIEGMGIGVEGVIGANFEGIYIYGGTIEGNGNLSTEANVKMDSVDDVVIDGVYMEATGPNARNIIFNSVRGAHVRGGRCTGTTPAGGIDVTGDSYDVKLERLQCDSITIGSSCLRTVLTQIDYGNAGGSITDNASDTVKEGLHNSSNEGQQAAGRGRSSHVNYARNGLFHRWISATDLDGATAGGWSLRNGATIARAGDGESDTEKYKGHYCVKMTTAAVTNSGLVYQGPTVDASENQNLVATATVWAKSPSSNTFDIQSRFGGDIKLQSFTATNTWQKFSASFPLLSATDPQIELIGTIASQVYYFDAFSLTLGEYESHSEFDNLKQIEPEPTGTTFLTFSATPTIYLDTATMYVMTLTGNITAITLSDAIPGVPFYIKFIQDGTGAHTVGGWPAAVKWAGGAAPTITATANKADMIGFMYDGTNYNQIALEQNL